MMSSAPGDVKVKQCELKHDGQLTEGPHWDGVRKELLLVDIGARSVLRWDPQINHLRVATFEDTVGAAVPEEGPGEVYLVSVGTDLVRYDWATGQRQVLHSVETYKPSNRFNDGKCDPAGRFWNGTMERDANINTPDRLGALYTLESDLTLRTRLPHVGLSNGLDWLPGGKMVYVDSKEFAIDVLDYDQTTGDVSNRQRAVAGFLTGTPDGLTLDTSDKVWLARFGGASVSQCDLETGQVLRTIDMPTSNITSVAFGGPNLDVLYVTSASLELGPVRRAQQAPHAGKVFRIEGLGARGRPANPFKKA